MMNTDIKYQNPEDAAQIMVYLFHSSIQMMDIRSLYKYQKH